MKRPHITRRTLFHTSAAAALAVTLPRIGGAKAQQSVAERDIMEDKRPVLHDNGLKFGCYDPYGDFSAENRVSTEHLFLPWLDVELSGLGEADDYAQSHGRDVLITIEPWSWNKDWNVTPGQLRDQIISGQHDATLRAVLDAVAGFKSPITIRWAQEMENQSGRFTWSNWRPADYLQAYRRMVDIIRDVLPNATIMWSPKGEKNLGEYYPGDDYADVIGLSVFGLEQYDRMEFGQPRTFREWVKQGYELTQGYGKDIIVAELGYEGSPDYLASWIEDVTRAYPEYPQLKKVAYFNDKEVWEWPHGLGLPDWRVVRMPTNYPVRR